MSKNIQQPLKEARQIMSHWRQGSPKTRYNEKLMMKQIIYDFYAVNRPVHSMKEARLSDVYQLITYWKKKQLSSGSIINRLSLLRKYLKQINSSIEIPSNKALNLKRDYDAKVNQLEKLSVNIVDQVYHPVTKLMLKLQILLGLTKLESLRFVYYPLDSQNKFIRISKSIAHNHRDRVIPIIKEEQKVLIVEFQKFVGEKLSLENLASKTNLLAIYHGELLFNHVASNTLFRAAYAKERYQGLVSQRLLKSFALKMLSQELGLKDVKKIQSWVSYEQECIEKNDLLHQ